MDSLEARRHRIIRQRPEATCKVGDEWNKPEVIIGYVKEAMRVTGASTNAVARKSGVSRQSLAAYFSGTRLPARAHIKAKLFQWANTAWSEWDTQHPEDRPTTPERPPVQSITEVLAEMKAESIQAMRDTIEQQRAEIDALERQAEMVEDAAADLVHRVLMLKVGCLLWRQNKPD